MLFFNGTKFRSGPFRRHRARGTSGALERRNGGRWANLSVVSSEFKKMYKNYYVSAYDAGATVVTMDGYLDPTERENTIISGNLINEIVIGSATHTLLFGAEIIDTTNNNHGYNTYWSTTHIVISYNKVETSFICEIFNFL